MGCQKGKGKKEEGERGEEARFSGGRQEGKELGEGRSGGNGAGGIGGEQAGGRRGEKTGGEGRKKGGRGGEEAGEKGRGESRGQKGKGESRGKGGKRAEETEERVEGCRAEEGRAGGGGHLT